MAELINSRYANDHYRAVRRAKHAAIRAEIVELLGGECSTCSEDRPLALQVHHVNGGGAAHRRQYGNGPFGGGGGSTQYYREVLKAIKAGSDEFDLQCANCHQIEHLSRPN